MLRKPKTLKDVWYCFSGYCNSMCIKQSTPALQKWIKQWIKFLEKESYKSGTEYSRGHFQAEILREIFDIHES